ncbi:MAG: sodium-dependent transporter [SAR86 cluster bacterium]|jgi:NSS family neurotransmitter:Na+ symporter|nr:sodium-dependent transporter [SAR86 cluster bacterium]
MTSEARKSIHGTWTGKWTFILAAAGSAVGLGNIWKFPYMAGEYGGGAFVLVYLVCILLIGVPIMIAEILLGRRGRRSPANTMAYLAVEARAFPQWKYLGMMGAVAGLLILSFYSVAAGWAFAYIFEEFNGTSAEYYGQEFDSFLKDETRLIFFHSIFIFATIFIVARGVIKGIEIWINRLMPILFIIIVLLCVYATQTGAFFEGVSYLFTPDFSKINAKVILAALGQAFFTLSLGMGAIMAYGAYMPANQNIGSTALYVAFLDTLVALLAGIAIFPIVFANNLEPAVGPGLVFVTLPWAFVNMPLGIIFGKLFFVLLTIAALSSAISLLEPGVAWIVESLKIKRYIAAAGLGFIAWTLGIFSALSFDLLAGFTPIGDKNFFDSLDFLSNQVLLPLGGIFIAIFVGWVMKRSDVFEELNLKEGLVLKAWFFLLKFVSPLVVGLIFVLAVFFGVVT